MKISSTYLNQASHVLSHFHKSPYAKTIAKMSLSFSVGGVVGMLLTHFLARYDLIKKAHAYSSLPKNDTTQKLENLAIGFLVAQPIHLFQLALAKKMALVLQRLGYKEISPQVVVAGLFQTNQISHPYAQLISKIALLAYISLGAPILEEFIYRKKLHDSLKTTNEMTFKIDYPMAAISIIAHCLPYVSWDLKKSAQKVAAIVAGRFAIMNACIVIQSQMNKYNATKGDTDSLSSRIQCVFVNATIFSLDHLHSLQGISNVFILINTFCAGIFFATLREMTGSIIPSTVAHTWHNTHMALGLIDYMEKKKI